MTINYKFQYNKNTFDNNPNIISVDLGDNEWLYGNMYRSFNNCTNLSNVTNINNNVFYMDGTFTFCKNMIDAPVLPTNAKYLIQPFWGCYNLVNAPVIPYGVINMYRTFAWCNSLVDAPVIPETVIDMYATFNQCSSLVNAPVIPNSVTNVVYTFWGCSNLVNAPVIPAGITNMFGTFYECSKLINAPVIPDSVVDMSGTFEDCSSLLDAPVIPNNVTNLSETFYRCSNLVNISEIPNSVTTMNSTFVGCESLAGDIIIRSSSIENASFCFYNTILEKNVYIPFKNNGINTPTFNSFINAGYSTSIRVNGALLMDLNYDDLEDWRYDTLNNGTRLLYEYLGNNIDLVVPTNNTLINNYNSYDEINTPFYNKQQFNSIDLAYVPVSYNKMDTMFSKSKNLKSVTNINNNVTTMMYAFEGCSNLVNVNRLPENLEDMYGIFRSCVRLEESPVIPNNVYRMGSAFEYCYNLVNAPEIPSNVTSMYFSFSHCYNLVNAPVIPSNVANMSGTFAYCYKFVNAPVIPNSVTNMAWTFANCNNLVNASNIPDSVFNTLEIFIDCPNLVNAPLFGNNVNDMSYAFANCYNLVNAPVIPNSVTNLSGTFWDCYNLVNAPVIPNSVINIYDRYYELSNKYAGLFENCYNLTGNIYIQSENIVNATNTFLGTSLNKDVYIPFQNNGVNTATYNSFINAGYSTTVRKHGALLMDINYNEFDGWRYETLPNGTNLLYEYLGTNTRIIAPTNNTMFNNYTSGNTTSESNTPFFENQNVIYAELENVPWTNNSMAYSFYNAQNVYGIYNIHPDVINFHKAFFNCFNLTEITLPGSIYDTGTDITGMFEGCNSLSNIVITGEIPSNSSTNSISRTFSGTGITTTPPLPGSVEDLSWAFENCFYLVNTSALPAGAVNMQGTFYNCFNLKEYKEITSNRLDDMSWTFWNCTNLVNSGSISSSVTNMYQTYWNCSNMNMIPSIPTNVINMVETFYNCQTINRVPNISNNVTNIYGAFDSCISITGMINIASENIINADNIFNNTSLNKDVYIPFKYENGEYTTTYNSFTNAGYDILNRVNGVKLFDLYNPELSEWRYDTLGNGTKLLYEYLNKSNADLIVPSNSTILNNYNASDIINVPFYNNQQFNSVDLNNVPFIDNSMASAFSQCHNIKSVTNINTNIFSMSFAFSYCSNLVDAPVIPNSVTDLSGAFCYCSNFSNITNIPESVINMDRTFKNCPSLINAPEIPNNVTNMWQTFYNCFNLTGDIIIHSENITDANFCFGNLFYSGVDLDKNVYIPFQNNGINTETYNAFTNAGYSSTTRKEGALLIDLNSPDIDLSDYDYIDTDGDVELTFYKGDKKIIVTPHV